MRASLLLARPARLALACLLFCSAAPLTAATKVESSKEALSDIQQRIESLKKELDLAQEAHADAADALKESEKNISQTNRKLFELNQQHQQNRAKLEGLQDQKADLQSTVQQQKKLLSAQLYQQYLHGQQSYVQVLLQQQDPGAMARQLQYFSYVSKARASLIAAMQANLSKITRLNEATSQALKQITELKLAQEQERRELQAQKAERGKVLSKLSTQISAQRNQIDKLKRDEKSLSQLVEKLTKLALAKPKPKPAKRQSAQSQQNQSRQSPSAQNQDNAVGEPLARNEALPSNAYDGGSFAALRGKLNLPVRGAVINRFGAAREDTGISWKGLFIKSAEGSEVKAIAGGRVVFADWMRGFGNLLIIDHGDGYMSLYGNNQALLKQTGDSVKGGDSIATVGNSGGNDSSGLYYELRKQSKPFDPLSWSVLR